MEVTYLVSMYVTVRIEGEYRALHVQIEKKEGASYAMLQIEQLLA